MQDIYTYTVPVFIKMLGGLKNILAKAESYAREHKMDDSRLLSDAIIFDMFPLVKQVQVACDNAKSATARLAGIEAPKYEDSEKTFAELSARIDTTVAFLQSVPEVSFADAATRQVTMPFFPGKYMTGFDYAREYAIPNFFFHLTTAYDIVRKNGVPIGKSDFTVTLPLKDL